VQLLAVAYHAGARGRSLPHCFAGRRRLGEQQIAKRMQVPSMAALWRGRFLALGVTGFDARQRTEPQLGMASIEFMLSSANSLQKPLLRP
jgi:hypothetical protein